METQITQITWNSFTQIINNYLVIKVPGNAGGTGAEVSSQEQEAFCLYFTEWLHRRRFDISQRETRRCMNNCCSLLLCTLPRCRGGSSSTQSLDSQTKKVLIQLLFVYSGKGGKGRNRTMKITFHAAFRCVCCERVWSALPGLLYVVAKTSDESTETFCTPRC